MGAWETKGDNVRNKNTITCLIWASATKNCSLMAEGDKLHVFFDAVCYIFLYLFDAVVMELRLDKSIPNEYLCCH